MKTVAFVLILSLFSITLFSQNISDKPHGFDYRQSIQIELFGHGLFYSLSYERLIFNSPVFKTAIQAGAAWYPPASGIIEFWFPLTVNEVISFGKHHLEIGGGHVFTNEPIPVPAFETKQEREWGGFITGRVGYRFQKPSSRLFLRLGFTPFIEYRNIIDFHPSGGLALGYGF